MSVHQKGLRVLCTRAFGLILLLFSFISLLGGLALLVYATASQTFSEATLAGLVLNLLQSLALAWPASFLIGMFPDLDLYGDHIRIKVIFFEYRVAKQGIKRIITSPTFDGNAILFEGKGYLLNLLYGLFFFRMWDHATIMLSTDEKNVTAVKDYLQKE